MLASVCPYHYEVGEEEWLLVLAGRPTLRQPEGSEALEPWDVIAEAFVERSADTPDGYSRWPDRAADPDRVKTVFERFGLPDRVD